MASPSERFHCEPCTLGTVSSPDTSSQMLEFESSLVRLFIQQSTAEHDFVYPPVENVPPAARQRHIAAQLCAATILRNECPLFIYQKAEPGRGTIQLRPTDFSPGSLKIVK